MPKLVFKLENGVLNKYVEEDGVDMPGIDKSIEIEEDLKKFHGLKVKLDHSKPYVHT